MSCRLRRTAAWFLCLQSHGRSGHSVITSCHGNLEGNDCNLNCASPGSADSFTRHLGSSVRMIQAVTHKCFGGQRFNSLYCLREFVESTRALQRRWTHRGSASLTAVSATCSRPASDGTISCPQANGSAMVWRGASTWRYHIGITASCLTAATRSVRVSKVT